MAAIGCYSVPAGAAPAADIDPERIGQDLHIIIKIRAKYGKRYKQNVGEKLAKIPGVWAVFFVFGDEDFIVHARGRNRSDLVRMVESFTDMEEIERTSSVIVGEVIKLDHRVNLETNEPTTE